MRDKLPKRLDDDGELILFIVNLVVFSDKEQVNVK